MTRRKVLGIGLVLMGFFVLGTASWAQDVPFTWKGEGKAAYLQWEGLEDVSFQYELNVDDAGWVQGKLFNDEGGVTLEKLYYSEKLDGYRLLVMVVTLKDSDDPKLFILNGKVLQDQLIYGEILVKDYDEKGEVEKGLALDDKTAVEIYEDYLPGSLKTAMKNCKFMGCFFIKGDYAQN